MYNIRPRQRHGVEWPQPRSTKIEKTERSQRPWLRALRFPLAGFAALALRPQEKMRSRTADMGSFGRRYPWRQAAITALLMIVILFMRRPEAFIHPSLWAEDGPIFLAQAEESGVSALTRPYNGYHHLALRLVAMAASALDYRWIPTAYLAGSTAVVVALALVIHSPRLNLPHPFWCALAIVLVPQSGEVHNTLTNIQWLMALGLLLLALAADPATWVQWAVDVAAALLAGLTGIFSVLFLPFYVWRAAVRRSAASYLLVAVIASAAAVQVATFVHSIPGAARSWDDLALLFRVVAMRTIASWLLPPSVAENLCGWKLALLGCPVAAFVAYGIFDRARYRDLKLTLAAAGVLVIAATAFRFRGDIFALSSIENGDRYFFIPKVLLAWLLILEWSSLSNRGRAAVAACALSLLSTCYGWRFLPYRDYEWTVWAGKLNSCEKLEVPINPAGTTVTLHARPKAKTGA